MPDTVQDTRSLGGDGKGTPTPNTAIPTTSLFSLYSHPQRKRAPMINERSQFTIRTLFRSISRQLWLFLMHSRYLISQQHNFFHTVELLRVCFLDHFCWFKIHHCSSTVQSARVPGGEKKGDRFTVLRFLFYVNRLNIKRHLLFFSTTSSVSMPLAPLLPGMKTRNLTTKH